MLGNNTLGFNNVPAGEETLQWSHMPRQWSWWFTVMSDLDRICLYQQLTDPKIRVHWVTWDLFNFQELIKSFLITFDYKLKITFLSGDLFADFNQTETIPCRSGLKQSNKFIFHNSITIQWYTVVQNNLNLKMEENYGLIYTCLLIPPDKM